MTLPIIRENNYRTILEVGASMGDNTDQILEIKGVSLTIIDPCLDCDLVKKFSDQQNVKVIKDLSLNGLKKLSTQFDCIFIDDDHNWYTVYNELKIIKERNLLKVGGTIFLHDVGWPYGRRDMYYLPETIPAEFFRPNARKGMIPGQSELVDEGGVNPRFFNALSEGGLKNGVLTAIEDFIKNFGPNDYNLLVDPRQYGLGILIYGKNNNSSWARQWSAKLKYLSIKARFIYFIKSRLVRIKMLRSIIYNANN